MDTNREQDPGVRARNRKLLLVLIAVCVVLATLGYLYASWLFTLPSVVKPG